MSLYHEAAEILTKAKDGGGSLKSLAFGKRTGKTDSKTLFALTTEAAKWSDVLSEVVEKSGILSIEKQLTPTLTLLLAHDLLLSKKGIALPRSHGLNAAITRHKARLTAELTKVRLRRGFPTLELLRAHIDSGGSGTPISDAEVPGPARHPRWIRINTIKSTLAGELDTTFADFDKVDRLLDVRRAALGSKPIYVDQNVPNLVAVSDLLDPTVLKAYKEGKLILQEKASCFPAYLLNSEAGDGDVMDACAAPGNKTTHLAAILNGPSESATSKRSRVIACEKDAERSQTLHKMVKLAGAENIVTVKQQQDFLKLKPNSKECANITSILLDPSCSGSGIVGRDEVTVKVHLPSIASGETAPKGKKRKREAKPAVQQPTPQADKTAEETPDEEEVDGAKLRARLKALSGFQLVIIEHAMSFPAAKRISYSTCSVHAEENEHVVLKALQSSVAMERGWRISKRSEQVDGLRKWPKRGSKAEDAETEQNVHRRMEYDEVIEACIRCEKGGDDGTMGFFVAGFVRDDEALNGRQLQASTENDSAEESEWDGFSEDES